MIPGTQLLQPDQGIALNVKTKQATKTKGIEKKTVQTYHQRKPNGHKRAIIL